MNQQRHFPPHILLRLLSVMVAIMLSVATLAQDAETGDASQDQEKLDFVRGKVLPLLQARCFECHGASVRKPKGDLRMTSAASILRGGESGAAITPGNPDESLLIQAVRYEGMEMPPRSRLPEGEIAILEKWVRDGALWPAELETPVTPAEDISFPLEERKASHWAWQPLSDAQPPDVQDSAWGTDTLDMYILRRLEDAGLRPADDADRNVLIRRLYFDIIGLPPTSEEVDAFVNDPAATHDAMATVADRLLSSDHVGERWGRHWLDLVRYAETLGHEFDYPLRHATEYRDYVIRALNADVPYDQFVREHIAGDLLEHPRLNPELRYNESIIGTGFWFLGEDKHAPVDVRGEEAARIDNQIDVFSKTFLGMTVACARCHDHKFDAIRAADYYALAGFLQSSRRQVGLLDPEERIQSAIGKIEPLRHEAVQLLEQSIADPGALESQITQYLLAARECIANGPEEPDARIDEVAAQRELSASLLKSWIRVLSAESCRHPDHPLSLWAAISASTDEPSGLITQWKREVTAAIEKSDADSNTVLLADFSDGIPDDWFNTGQALDRALSAESSCLVVSPPEGDAPASLKFLPGNAVDSRQYATQANGVLRSPTFELTHPELLYRIAGDDATIRLIIDGYVMDEFSGLLFAGAKLNIKTDGKTQWIRQSADVGRYVGHRCHIEIIDHGNGWFRIEEIRLAERGAAPPEDRPHPVNESLATAAEEQGASPATDDTFSAELAILAARLSHELVAYTLAPSSQELKWHDIAANERLLTDASLGQLDRIAAEWAAAAASMPQPRRVVAIADGSAEDEYLFIRGSHLNPGERIPRRFLEALGGLDQPIEESGSGRLELARQMLSDNNPLLSRVAVNRVWHHLFGRGIVPTTDNFGVLGQPPSHPLLLDRLAADFRRDGWSMKRLIRRVVLSRTYRMASTVNPLAESIDPTNALLHRSRIRRLEGEVIRDAILQVSGRLDRTLFGVSVPVHLTPFMQGRGRPGTDGPLDGDGRRSIYVAVNRNFLSPMMLAFDTPSPATAIGRRTVSNVPAQALMLLNDEFVTQQADRWAGEILHDVELTPEDRVRRMIRAAYARDAADDEVRLLIEFLRSQAAAHRLSNDTWTRDRKVWTDLAHALFNTKEFVFLR